MAPGTFKKIRLSDCIFSTSLFCPEFLKPFFEKMGVKKRHPGLERGKWDIFDTFGGNPGCASPGRNLLKYKYHSFFIAQLFY
jgi:hypothetical protein